MMGRGACAPPRPSVPWPPGLSAPLRMTGGDSGGFEGRAAQPRATRAIRAGRTSRVNAGTPSGAGAGSRYPDGGIGPRSACPASSRRDRCPRRRWRQRTGRRQHNGQRRRPDRPGPRVRTCATASAGQRADRRPRHGQPRHPDRPDARSGPAPPPVMVGSVAPPRRHAASSTPRSRPALTRACLRHGGQRGWPPPDRGERQPRRPGAGDEAGP